MNLLHLLQPEAAHSLSIWALKNGLGPRSAPDNAALETRLFGKTFLNPIGISAGADKKAEALAGWSKMGFGFAEAGSVTLKPRAGNPKPRIWRLGDGNLVNWMGLPGDGLEPFIARLKAFQAEPERKTLVLGANLASPEGIADEFRRMSSACAPLVDYITLNVSCPNVSGHGDIRDHLLAAQQHVKAVVAEAGHCPVMLKLGPTMDKDSLKLMVEAAMESGACGIVATNTTPHDKRALLAPLSFDWPVRDGKAVGGYSGPALLDTACWMVEQTRSIIGPQAPIIGGGGIQCGIDALRMLKSGANAIQLYTGLIYKGHSLINEIKEAIISSA